MKKVVSGRVKNVINKSALTHGMIIVFKHPDGGLFKLWKLDSSKYSFVSLQNTTSHYGKYNSFKAAINSIAPDGDLYVLDDIREISEIPRKE